MCENLQESTLAQEPQPALFKAGTEGGEGALAQCSNSFHKFWGWTSKSLLKPKYLLLSQETGVVLVY